MALTLSIPVLILSLLAAPASAEDLPASPVLVGAGAGEEASAIWLFLEGDRAEFFFVDVFSGVGPAGAEAVAYVGRGECTVERDGEDFTSITCAGFADGYQIRPGEFEMSPLLDSARLDFSEGGHHQRVTWEALDPLLGADTGSVAGTSGAGAGAVVYQEHRATGEVFGRPLEGPFDAFAGLARGGGGAAGPAEPIHSRTIGDDGVLHVTLRHAGPLTA